MFWHFCGNFCMSRGALQKLLSRRQAGTKNESHWYFVQVSKNGSESWSSRFVPMISLISFFKGFRSTLKVNGQDTTGYLWGGRARRNDGDFLVINHSTFVLSNWRDLWLKENCISGRRFPIMVSSNKATHTLFSEPNLHWFALLICVR